MSEVSSPATPSYIYFLNKFGQHVFTSHISVHSYLNSQFTFSINGLEIIIPTRKIIRKIMNPTVSMCRKPVMHLEQFINTSE